MKIIFFGTGKFGLPALKKILKSRHDIAAVVTTPDKKRGRGQNVRPTPVKALVEQAAPDIQVFQPEKVSDAEFIARLKTLNADIFVIIDYGRILPKEVLTIPRKYCINLHPSLLPRYRGAAPINRALLDGEPEAGNTVIRMDERMDAGDIITQEKVTIRENEDAAWLSDVLSAHGAALVVKTLSLIESGDEKFVKQDENKATYAPKLEKKEGKIDWASSCDAVVKKIRAMQPWPGAFTMLDGRTLKILEARTAVVPEDARRPGTVIDTEKFVVKASEGAVCVVRLQPEGKRPMTARAFLRGYPLKSGVVLE
ncbi:MAG: methionyl-tRNA formyltransferase [Candidatus Omnitrophota bacterium]